MLQTLVLQMTKLLSHGLDTYSQDTTYKLLPAEGTPEG